MIFTGLSDQVAYRLHVPRWATQPLSGEGAALHGGRANRPGVPALYLALEVEMALAEYRQLSPLLPPSTLVSYRLTLPRVVDFRGGYTGEPWDALWSSFDDDWRALWFDRRVEPASWVLGDAVIEAGATGLLFRSSRADGGTNLVVCPDRVGDDDAVRVHDPDGELPRNQDSWR